MRLHHGLGFCVKARGKVGGGEKREDEEEEVSRGVESFGLWVKIPEGSGDC